MRALGVVRQLTTSDSLGRGRVDYLLLLVLSYSGFQAGVDTSEGKIFRIFRFVRPVAPGNFLIG